MTLKSLVRTDTFQLDHGMVDWQQNFSTPTVYNESDLPTLTVEIAKAPDDIGALELLYVPQPTTLDGSGIKLNIPDEMEGAVLWGALADLLGSDGEAHDPERSAFCETMYNMMVEITGAMLEGV